MAKRSNNSLGRRSHGGKPYDANNSFVKKMANKVTDFIPQPSWISKWFNTSQDNGDMSNNTDNPEDGDPDEDMRQPPSKRPRIRMDITHPPGTFAIQPRSRNLSNNDNDSSKDLFSHGNDLSEEFLEPPAAGPSGVRRFVSSTPAVQDDVRNSNAQTTVLNSLIPPRNNGTTNGADDNSESSESTSGCSSLIPQTNRQEGTLKSNYNSTFSRRKRFIDKTSFANHLQSPRSLFLDSGSRESLSSRRPSFNASMINNTLERTSSLSSPFYSGNVTFGGANALNNIKRSRSLFNNSSNEFQLQVPRRTNVQVKPSNPESMDSSGMSQTAKRILEAMEYFSSPISDAKKIPLKNSPNLNTTTTGKKRSRDEDVAVPATRVGLRHLTRELAVPTVPDLLKLRRRQKLQDTTVAARKIVSSRGGPPPSSTTTTQSAVSEEYHLRTELDKDPKFHGKLRTKSKKNPDEDEPAPIVNLPSISLPITSLPSFDIPLPKYTKPPTSQKPTGHANTEDGTGFKFASPIKVSESSWNLKSINNFSFSKPLNANGKNLDDSRDTDLTRTSAESNISNESFTGGTTTNFIWSGSSTAPRLKVKNKQSERDNKNANNSLSMEAATELKTGSVMDILGGNNATGTGSESGSSLQNKSTSQMFNFGTGAKPITSIWECAECYIKNDSSETVCLACKAAKPSATKTKDLTKVSLTASNVVATPEQSRTVKSDCLGSQFKINSSQWECQSCLVRNKQTNLKCVSCTAPKPGNKSAVTEAAKAASSSTLNSDLSDMFKPPEDSWECPGCMLRNPCTSITCPCCNASKPSFLKFSPKKNTFNNSQLMDKFNPTSSSWECSSCLVRNNETANSCVCCSNPKPGAASSNSSDSNGKTNDPKPFTTSGWGDKFKKPEGSWSCDSCLVQNKPESTECAACGGVKPGAAPKSITSTVSFGIPTDAQNFKFGIDNNSGKTASATNLASSNGFSFGTKPPSSDASTAATQFSFGIPKDANKTGDSEESGSKPTGFVFASPKTAGSGGYKFGVNKSGEKSTETEPTAKSSGSNDKSKSASSFSFGLPISTGDKRKAVEEEKQTNFGVSTDSTSSKPSFVFGIQKSDSNQVDTSKSGPKMNASTGDTSPPKSSGFGSEGVQPIKRNDSGDVQASTTKSNMTGSEQPAATIFASLTNTSTSTTASSLPAETPSPFTFSEPKSKLSQPSFSSTFGQSSGNASTPITSSTFASGVQNSSETKLNTETDKKQSVISFGVGSTTSTASTVMPLPSPAIATPSFGISPSPSPLLSGNTIETRPTASPAFGSTENNTTLFGMPTINKTPAFGTVEKKNPTFASMENNSAPTFGTTDKPAASPMFNSPSPAFGVPTPASQPIFGSSTNSVFGNNTASVFGTTPSGATSNIFAAAKSSATPTPTNTGLFTFGASAAQSTTTPGFGFSGNTNCETNKLMFGFGSTPNTQQGSECFGGTGASTAGAFGTPATVNPTPSTAFTFNAPPKQEPPAFGQGATSIPGIFGAQSATPSITPAQPTSTFASSTPAASTGFNFAASASAPTTGSFNFSGAMNQPATAPASGFNFTAPSASPAIAFDPNTRPSFNFTGGSAPPAFNATPQAAAAGRKIKKAVRRMPQR